MPAFPWARKRRLLASPSVPPTPLTIACSTVSLFARPLDQVFPLISEAGFAAVEVMVTKDPDTGDPDRLRELAEDHGVRIAAIHAPFLLMTRRVWGTDPVGKIRRALELAEAVRADIVIVHPPYRWQSGYGRWLREDLAAELAETEVRVAVENMFPIHVRGRRLGAFHSIRTLEDLEGFVDVALDTSHAAVAGLDLLETVDRLGARLAHVHLSNNAGTGWDSHLPLDEGVLPLDRFLGTLAASGFGGTISLELDLRRHRGDPDGLRRALSENLRRCAEWTGTDLTPVPSEG